MTAPIGGRSASALVLMAILATGTTSAVAQSPVPGGPACLAEAEPNDKPEQAPSLAGEICFSGSLVEQDDQDLFFWEIAPQDGATTWAFTMRGVPATITSAHVFALPDPVVYPIVDVAEVFRADSDEHLGTPPITTETRLAPGHYLVGVSRGYPGADELADDRDYELRITRAGTLPPSGDVEPNDDPAGATPVAGAFELSGDAAGSNDAYRWTLSADDAGRSWRIEALTSVGAPLHIALDTVAAEPVTWADAGLDGSAAVHDLRLPAGEYIITLSGGQDEVQPYILRAVVVTDPDIDPEPNDTTAHAVPLDPDTLAARGRLAAEGDVDTWLLGVDDALAGRLLDIALTWSDGAERTLCVTTEAATQVGCSDGVGAIGLSDLSLPAGRYLLAVSGAPGFEDRYELRVTPGAEAAADHEAEPNDTPDTATRWDPTVVMHGSASGVDVDTYRVRVDAEPVVWRLDVTGTGISGISWIRPDLTPMGSPEISADGSEAAVDDLYLIRGDHLVTVQAEGDYELVLTVQGSPADGAEREPNDDSGHAETLRISSTRTGRLPTASDWDLYRFTLMGAEHVILRLEPPAGAVIEMGLWYGLEPVAGRPAQPGEAQAHDLFLPPGDYEVQLRATVPSREPYSLSLERADPFALAADQEPNDSFGQARPLPATLVAHGTAKVVPDSDWYRLPTLAAAGGLTIRIVGEVSLNLTDGLQFYELTLQPDGVTYSAEALPADVPLYLEVTAWADYRLSISGDGLFAGPEPVDPPVELSLRFNAGAVAAFRREGQRLAGTLSIESGAETDLELTVDGVASQWDWKVEADPDRVSVPQGTTSVPVAVDIPPDAWSVDPVRVTVRVRDATGGQRTAFAEVVVDPDAEPVGPTTIWTVPAALLGGLNVASAALGAIPGGTLDPEGEKALFDGVTPDGAGFSIGYAALPVDIDVDLAGDTTVPVAGVIIHPEGIVTSLSQYPGEFDLLLSNDGADWQVVLSGRLEPLAVDQAFALPEPVDARFARLRIRSTYGLTSGLLALAEWKVVAAPGTAPSSGSLDTADPALGGHIVWMEPWLSDRGLLARMLDADRGRETTSGTSGDEFLLVLGFRDDRAAQITELGWVDPDGSDPATRLESIAVEVSTSSPLGPWRPLGTWSLERAEDGAVAPFPMPAETWARFLRLRAPIPASAASPDVDTLELPASLRVIERATDSEYRSVVGEWGDSRPSGPYEWLTSATLAPTDRDAGDSPEAATPLPPDVAHRDRVRFEHDEDWYAISVPEGQETLSISITAQPSSAVEPILQDAHGRLVPLTLSPGLVDEALWKAIVLPGESYSLRVHQPPFSSVVTFDVSGSLGPWVPRIMGAARTFASGVEPGREAVMIVPFEEKPLLEDWSDDPGALRDAVDAWPPAGSSGAVPALLDAARLLRDRTGTHAIFVIHDAEDIDSYLTPTFWRTLARVRAVIFPVLVSVIEPATARGVFQDWASADDGFFQYATTQTDMDKAFARMAAWLRRTADYSISWSTAHAEHSPSTLRVSPPMGESVPIGAGAVAELILDTSGSMLKELGTSTRIAVARETLVRVVAEALPDGLPVALRTFKPKKKSCDTILAMPLAPLERGAMVTAIGDLVINKTTKTPLAAALEQVLDDLGAATGPRIVVLVTDGAETCKGDPAAAVRALREAGFEATVNIVGFALDDPELKARMASWAADGGGRFFDAQDPATLLTGITTALQAPFRVYDQDGAQVASGVVGGPEVELAPGAYRVEVLSDPPTTFERVVLPLEGSVELTVGEPAP